MLLSRDKHAQLEVFNDIDGSLINLYRCIQYHCAELQREIRLGGEQIPPNSRELFQDYIAQLGTRGLTDIQRAARYFYIIRISYGADKRSFGCNKKALERAIERLPDIQQRLRDVVIENRDFEQIIRTYDRPDALLYVDPPYFKAEKHYDGFSPEDHTRLLGLLKGCKGKFVLSYNDEPEVRDIYKGFNIHELARTNPLANKNGGGAVYRELVITNYEDS